MKIRYGVVILLLIMVAGSASAQQDDIINISGQVLLGTPDGAAISENLPVELQIINVESGLLETRTTTIDAEGNFNFINIPSFGPEIFYAVGAAYGGIKQFTPPFAADELDFVELRLYETTDSYEDLVISSATMQVDFTDVRQIGLSILLELQIFNNGDHIVYALDRNEENNLRSVSFFFELPVGAYGVAPGVSDDRVDAQGRPTRPLYEVQENVVPVVQRFNIAEGIIPIVYDSQPIIPDWPTAHLIRVSYFLPYTDGAVIDQVFPTEVRNYAVWVPEDTIQVTSEQFRRIDNETTNTGRVYQVYRQISPQPANENLVFTLEGIPTQTVRRQTRIESDDDDSLAAILLALGGTAAFMAGGGFLLWRNRRTRVQDIPPSNPS